MTNNIKTAVLIQVSGQLQVPTNLLPGGLVGSTVVLDKMKIRKPLYHCRESNPSRPIHNPLTQISCPDLYLMHDTIINILVKSTNMFTHRLNKWGY
jgi:hypothetical protein